MALDVTTQISRLETRYAAITSELAAITTTPVSYSIDGQNINHTERIKALYEELDLIQKAIQRLKPYQIMSKATT